MYHGDANERQRSDEDLWIERFCTLLKLILRLKLINFHCTDNVLLNVQSMIAKLTDFGMRRVADTYAPK